VANANRRTTRDGVRGEVKAKTYGLYEV